MNLHPFFGRGLAARCIATLCIVAVCGGALAACGSSNAGTENVTAAPTEPVTLPDLTDDRVPTSTADYAARVESAFSETPVTPAEDFTYTVEADGVTITGYTGGEVVIRIPDTVEGKPVTTIADGAFAGKGTLQALAIPDSVTVIGVGALKNCRALTTLRTPVITSPDAPYFGALFGATTYEINGSSVPATLQTLIVTGGDSVPDYGFFNCPMQVISLPATVTEIGDFAFYGCGKLIYLPLGHTRLRTVGERAFTNCRALLSVELPATVDTMGFAMLEGCGKLETLALPFVGTDRGIAETVEGGSADSGDRDEAPSTNSAPSTNHLGYLFGAKSYVHTAGYLPASLITVKLQEGCATVPENAFYECSSVREIILPEGVTEIGRRAFYGCAKLSKLAIPDSVSHIGDDACHGCIRLVDLSVGAGVKSLGVQVFMDCLSLETVTLPASVTTLPNSAFAGCRSLTTLTAPGVTVVEKQVFRHCDRLQGWDTATETVE